MSMVNWGDVPTWIQAVATALLLIAASIAGWYTHKIYKVESGRDKKYERERQAEQAGEIAGWMRGRYDYVISNASLLPVYDMIADFLVRHGRRDQPMPIGMEELPLLPPGEHTSHVPSGVVNILKSGQDGSARTLVRLTFTDASGQRWRRDYDGRLEEVGAVDAPGTGRWERALQVLRLIPRVISTRVGKALNRLRREHRRLGP